MGISVIPNIRGLILLNLYTNVPCSVVLKKPGNLDFSVCYKLTEKSLKDRLRYVTVLIKGEMSGISAMKCA